jgi:hypothetical protein
LSTALCGHHLVNPRTDFPYRAPLSAPAPFIGTRAPLSIPSTVLYGTDYLLQHRFVESSTDYLGKIAELLNGDHQLQAKKRAEYGHMVKS